MYLFLKVAGNFLFSTEFRPTPPHFRELLSLKEKRPRNEVDHSLKSSDEHKYFRKGQQLKWKELKKMVAQCCKYFMGLCCKIAY
jgi:hypothetical protein